MKAKVKDLPDIPCHAYDKEKYVLMHSGCFKKIYGDMMEGVNPAELEGLVKITYNCKSVYRRYRGYNMEGESVSMGYRTRRALRAKEDEEVTVTPTTWFAYLWYNQDSCIKHPFRIAFFGILFAIISFFLTMLGLLVSVISLILTLVSGGCCC